MPNARTMSVLKRKRTRATLSLNLCYLTFDQGWRPKGRQAAMKDRLRDDLIVPNHLIVFNHHALNLWWHDCRFCFRSRELTDCLDG